MLTGNAIYRAVAIGDIIIDPFDSSRLCANSYAFTLGDTLLQYDIRPGGVLDPRADTPVTSTFIDDAGYLIRPGSFYLSHTRETMGARRYAATLHACRDVSCLGLRIQLSAPLGHCGAIIPWTLELRATLPVRIYPGMIIGKITWWEMRGQPEIYQGKYASSRSVERSLLASDQHTTRSAIPLGYTVRRIRPGTRPDTNRRQRTK